MPLNPASPERLEALVVDRYSTYEVGQAAERYLALVRSWGEGGPKRVVSDILAGVARDSILAQTRADIATRLHSARGAQGGHVICAHRNSGTAPVFSVGTKGVPTLPV